MKSKAYLSSVRPILEYASTCWNPTSDKMNRAIESVQHKAAKFVTNTYPRKDKYHEFSVSKLIEELGWETLEDRRNNAKLSMIYKIRNNCVIIQPETVPGATKKTTARKCNEKKVGTQNELFEPPTQIINSGKTFFYMGPRLWNNLVTPAQADAPSLEAFQKHFCK